MTDDDGYAEDRDPLLVRPFLLGDADSEPSTQTWPAATTREVRSHRALEGADDPTAVLHLPKAHRRPARRRVLVVAAACLAVLLGATAAGFASMRGDSDPPATTALPGDLPTLATTGPLAGPPAPAATKPSATRRASPTHRARSTTSAPAAAGSSGATAAGPAADGARSASGPSAALAPDPPVTARVGTIGGQNGKCLDLEDGEAVEGNDIQVFDCNGTDAQRWTLATDGTLQVSGMCALIGGDNTVHATKCDGRTTALWTVSGQRLINAANAKCLTDPSGGTRSGTNATVTTCDGGAGQRWSLP